jgi:hypothetical protein
VTQTLHPGGLTARSEPDGDEVVLLKNGNAITIEKIVLAAIAAEHTKEPTMKTQEAWGIRLYDVTEEELDDVRAFLRSTGISFDETGDPNR